MWIVMGSLMKGGNDRNAPERFDARDVQELTSLDPPWLTLSRVAVTYKTRSVPVQSPFAGVL
jgi:hypothetical protein